MSQTKTLYRYEISSFCDSTSTVFLHEFTVSRETEKSFIVDEMKDWGKSVVISKTATKRFAYPTKEQALESLKIRKSRQWGILEKQIVTCKLSNEFPKDKTVCDLEEESSFSSTSTLFDIFN